MKKSAPHSKILASNRYWMFVALLVLSMISCDGVGKGGRKDNSYTAPGDSIQLYLDKNSSDSLSVGERKSYLAKALEIVRSLPDDTLKKSKLLEIRKRYLNKSDLENFKEVNRNILELSILLEDSTELASSYYNEGYYYFKKEKFDSAFNYYYRSERIYNKLNNDFNTGKALLSMAILQKNVKEYVGSESSTVQAIEYFAPLEDYRYLASANNNLAIISKDLGKYDEAIEYNQRALEFRKKLKNNKLLQVSSLNNIGIVYRNDKKYEEAIQYFKQGLTFDSLFQKKPLTYARLLDNLAYTKFLSGENEGMPGLFEEALEIRDSLGDNIGAVTSHLHLANYFKAQDAKERAYENARQALSISERLSYPTGILEALLLLSEVSDVADAIDYSKEYIRINDSIEMQDRAYRDQFARIRFETDAIETENTEVNRRNKQLFIGLLSLLAVFLLAYIFIQQKLNKKELLYRESQQMANEEIYNLMLTQQLKLEEGKQLEKKRLSEELHDGVLGRLFGTRLSLDSLNTKNDDEAVQNRLKYLEELKSIETEIRQISHGLNSTMFSKDVVFTEVVEQLVEIQNTLNNSSPQKFRFQNDDTIHWEEMPNNIKVHLYRIVQEALQNIQKHAKATKCVVSFTREGRDIVLRIIDDGVGMIVNKVKRGIGLKNISSRVKQMKGTLKVESEKGNGTEIMVKINYQ